MASVEAKQPNNESKDNQDMIKIIGLQRFDRLVRAELLKYVKKTTMRGKRVIVNLDFNRTCTNRDSTDGRSDDSVETAFLFGISETMSKETYGHIVTTTKTYFGRQREEPQWILDKENKHNDKDLPKTDTYMCYYDFLKKNCTADQVKEMSGKFTEPGQPGEGVREEFEKSYEHSRKKIMFASVANILDKLRDIATFVFKTFGNDGQMIIEGLRECGYTQKCLRFKIHREDGKEPVMIEQIPVLDEHGNHLIIKGVEQFTMGLQGGGTLTACQYNTMLETMIGVPVIVQEDYKYWNDRKRIAPCGKYVRGSDRLIQICFDDLDCWSTDSTNSQSDFLLNRGADGSADPELVEGLKTNNVWFFRVNTYYASVGEVFFIDRIMLVLKTVYD